MKMLNKFISLVAAGCICLLLFTGCAAQAEAEPDFSGAKEVANLSSLECYYHNVVKYHSNASGFLFGIGNIGEKNMWFEYDGIVKMGLNVDRVSISSPSENGEVTIIIPSIEILGHPDIDTESMTDPIESNGWFTSLSASDKNEALTAAQNNLLETAQNDVAAKAQALQRAKDILEQYVKNVGEAIGKTYTVKWEQAEA